MTFASIYRHGFARVAACTTRCHLADPERNAQEILNLARRCDQEAVALAVFPELCVSGYSIDDLFMQDALLEGVERATETLIAESAGLLPMLMVGAPLRHG